MKRKHFVLALVAMMSFTFSAFAQQVVTVRNAAEFRQALNSDVQRSNGMQRASAGTFALNITINLAAYDDPEQVQEALAAGWNVTLNLNGYTLNGDFVNNGNLTIQLISFSRS